MPGQNSRKYLTRSRDRQWPQEHTLTSSSSEGKAQGCPWPSLYTGTAKLDDAAAVYEYPKWTDS